MRSFNSIVVEHLKIPETQIEDTLKPADVPDWDSMNYLLFIAELEKAFGITFTMDEVLSADSLGAVKKIVQSKGIVI